MPAVGALRSIPALCPIANRSGRQAEKRGAVARMGVSAPAQGDAAMRDVLLKLDLRRYVSALPRGMEKCSIG